MSTVAAQRWSRFQAYGLSSEWVALLDEIESGDGVITDEIEQRLRSLAAATEADLDLAAGAVKAMEASEEELKAEAARLSARARTPAGIAQVIREAMGSVMDSAGMKSSRGTRYTVSRTQGRESVDVTNGDVIPAEFMVPQPPVLDRKALSDALKAGKEVPGAAMKRGAPSISIR